MSFENVFDLTGNYFCLKSVFLAIYSTYSIFRSTIKK